MSEARKAYEKQYRAANEAKIKERSKAYYQANKAKIKERSRKYYKNNTEIVLEKKRIYDKSTGAIMNKINNCKAADIKYGRQFDIDYDYCVQLLQQQNYICACCNKQVKIQWTTPNDPEQFSINRKDNILGHIKGNVEVTCLECNLILH